MADQALPRQSLLGTVVTMLVRAWQWLSSFRTPRCRFTPSCSEYAVESIRTHGALRGIAHSCARIARCHPWNSGGHDPVRPVEARPVEKA